MNRGSLRVLAIFEKPHALDGPFFEETIYVTPPLVEEPMQRAITEAMGRAAAVIGLRHGPIHAECRVNEEGVFVLEGGGETHRWTVWAGVALRHLIGDGAQPGSVAAPSRHRRVAGAVHP